MLSTAIVDVVDSLGQVHPCRMILDGGSQSNLLTERFCNKLNLPKKQINMPIKGIGESISHLRYFTHAQMKSRVNGFSSDVDWLIIPNIIERFPERAINKNKLQIPNNLKLADPNFHQPREIDALLGAEYFLHLLSVGQIKLNNEMTVLQKTKIG